jgi:hypothetical protein
VRLAKANVETMCSIMGGWSKAPLYKRKGDKKEAFLNLEVGKHSGPGTLTEVDGLAVITDSITVCRVINLVEHH